MKSIVHFNFHSSFRNTFWSLLIVLMVWILDFSGFSVVVFEHTIPSSSKSDKQMNPKQKFYLILSGQRFPSRKPGIRNEKKGYILVPLTFKNIGPSVFSVKSQQPWTRLPRCFLRLFVRLSKAQLSLLYKLKKPATIQRSFCTRSLNSFPPLFFKDAEISKEIKNTRTR